MCILLTNFTYVRSGAWCVAFFLTQHNSEISKFFSILDSPFNVTTVTVIAMAVFCAMCLGIIVYMKVKPAPKPKPDPDRETYL